MTFYSAFGCLIALEIFSNGFTVNAGVSKHALNRYIYIDLGANDGASVDAFLPKDEITEKNIAFDGSEKALNDKIFFQSSNNTNPMYDKRSYEIYVVEANPFFTPWLLEQQTKYETNKLSKSYILYNGTGISTKNGDGYLILDCP
eukprot:gene24126-25812_t